MKNLFDIVIYLWTKTPVGIIVVIGLFLWIGGFLPDPSPEGSKPAFFTGQD